MKGWDQAAHEGAGLMKPALTERKQGPSAGWHQAVRGTKKRVEMKMGSKP